MIPARTFDQSALDAGHPTSDLGEITIQKQKADATTKEHTDVGYNTVHLAIEAILRAIVDYEHFGMADPCRKNFQVKLARRFCIFQSRLIVCVGVKLLCPNCSCDQMKDRIISLIAE